MTGEHPNVGPELQQLAQHLLLLLLDPLIEALTAFTAPATSEPGACQQLWCPVCALAAIASGEQHPLSAIIAEHGATFLSLLRAIARPADPGAPHGDDQFSPEGGHAAGPASKYQPIPVTVHE